MHVTLVFRCKIGIKYLVNRRLRDPDAIVTNLYLNKSLFVFIGAVSGQDLYLPSLRRELQGI